MHQNNNTKEKNSKTQLKKEKRKEKHKYSYIHTHTHNYKNALKRKTMTTVISLKQSYQLLIILYMSILTNFRRRE